MQDVCFQKLQKEDKKIAQRIFLNYTVPARDKGTIGWTLRLHFSRNVFIAIHISVFASLKARNA